MLLKMFPKILDVVRMPDDNMLYPAVDHLVFLSLPVERNCFAGCIFPWHKIYY